MKIKTLSSFPYYGGKYYMVNEILSLMPMHNCYVEVFGGSGKVLLNKPVSKVEVFNDVDNNIYNLFKVLRDNYD
jgi:DNA adenine methylase